MSSDSSVSSNDGAGPLNKKLRRLKSINKAKTFQETWLNDDRFKNWLSKVPSQNNSAKCKVCNALLKCGVTELVRHSQSQKHRKQIKAYQATPSVSNLFKCQAEVPSVLDEQVKQLEIGLCAFFAEHNVALCIIDHLVPVLKNLVPDSEIVKKLSLGRTKCSGIVKNILGKVVTETIAEDLKCSKYSILIDESTDVSDIKSLCLLVKYKKPIDKHINTNLLELIELDARDCSAEKIFDVIKSSLINRNILLENMIGVASDGAAVMVGKNNSVFSRLANEIPHLIKLQCVCHSSALVASKACQELPRSPEDLIRNIATYISGSSKRCAVLNEFQEHFNLDKSKILKLASTRWLSMLNCVERTLKNWDALKEYFRLAVFEDHLHSATIILDAMNNLPNKIYLLFLSYVLQYFNSFNALFQTRDVLIHQLYDRSFSILTRLSSNFILPEKVHDSKTLNFSNPQNYSSLDKINLGHQANHAVDNLPLDVKYQIKTSCLNFFIKASIEIQNRLPFNILFEQFKFLNPRYVLNMQERDETVISLKHICDKFSNLCDTNKIDMQWQIISCSFTPQQKTELQKMNIMDFWYEISIAKDYDETFLFPDLSKLANMVLILPHSNAEAERIFSMVTDIKTKKRNRLAMETLNAMTVFRSYLQNENIDCTSFKIDKNHLRLHNKANIYK